MKSFDEARELAGNWLTRNLSSEIANGGHSWSGGPQISLLSSRTSRRTLGQDWEARYQPWALAWFAHPLPPGVQLRESERIVGASPQELPVGLEFADLEAVCRLAGEPWPTSLAVLTDRWRRLSAEFPKTAAATHLRRTAAWRAVDFDLLLKVATWFSAAEPGWPSLTARQIPIEGVHAKWLDGSRRGLVAELAGLPSLELAERPTRIHFTYADPAHRAADGRSHDSYTFGDTAHLAYQPTTVLICENKDTVVLFPEYPGLIVLEGNGDAGPTLVRQLPWIADAPHVFSWGDMDPKGYVILNRLREFGIEARSILMDAETHLEFERFGTNQEASGAPIPLRPRAELLKLTPSERIVYHQLTDPDWHGHRRVEQERIPLHVAVRSLQSALG